MQTLNSTGGLGLFLNHLGGAIQSVFAILVLQLRFSFPGSMVASPRDGLMAASPEGPHQRSFVFV